MFVENPLTSRAAHSHDQDVPDVQGGDAVVPGAHRGAEEGEICQLDAQVTTFSSQIGQDQFQ